MSFVNGTSSHWPNDVGILAMEIYFPYQFVDQSELEQFDGVSAGKYTIGLGQAKMGFCTDREDIHSICLTVVDRLITKQGLNYSSIGRLEVGTETLVDKSKSVKSVLMSLFADSGNTDIEGVDTTNACYGGTSALLNSISWIESSAWDGRYALVVCGDIAVYATGNARPTGGAGAVAMLIGPNAPLVFERGLRASHMTHAYDFYKPDLSSEYPTVDGKLSVKCYLSALDTCYQRYCDKSDNGGAPGATSLSNFDAVCFHSPYCKLVQKSVARLALNDFVRATPEKRQKQYPKELVDRFGGVTLAATYDDRDVEQAFVAQSKETFATKTKPSLMLANQIGNMYTPSLYGGLISLLISVPISDLKGKRVALFSYGSGLASTFFSLRIANTIDGNNTAAAAAATNGRRTATAAGAAGGDLSSGFSLRRLLDGLSDVGSRLERRQKVTPQRFADVMKLREDTHHHAPYAPVGDVSELFPGTWYLTAIDDKHRRTYDRTTATKHINNQQQNTTTLIK